MKKVTYKDNKNNGVILWYIYVSKNTPLTEVDKMFTAATGIDPVKAPWIGASTTEF